MLTMIGRPNLAAVDVDLTSLSSTIRRVNTF